jgi:hemolysin III
MVAARPLLRGYSHAVAAPLALAGWVTLVVLSRGDVAKQMSVSVYGACMVLLFALSAAYHVVTWKPRVREVLRRLDHSNIFLMIAGTYTAVGFNALTGATRVLILTAVWVPAAFGVALVGAGVRLPRSVLAGLYVLVGWVALLALPALLARFTPPALALIVAGGIAYSIGALLYALRWPPLWRSVFGYHEAFHLLVIAASASFFVFILRYVLPLQRV